MCQYVLFPCVKRAHVVSMDKPVKMYLLSVSFMQKKETWMLLSHMLSFMLYLWEGRALSGVKLKARPELFLIKIKQDQHKSNK